VRACEVAFMLSPHHPDVHVSNGNEAIHMRANGMVQH
jgi:hypothetical protein